MESQETFSGVNGPWPNSGSGIRLTGKTCEGDHRFYASTSQMVLGSFYIYAYGEGLFSITSNTATPKTEMIIYDCSGGEHDFADYFPEDDLGAFGGRIHFGGDGTLGYAFCWFNASRLSALPKKYPCYVPVAPTTWGLIKTLYGEGQKE